jgi:DNA-binding GntR family transcriptional regulator
MNECLQTFTNCRRGDMSTIGPVYPAQIVVNQAEIRLVADQMSDADIATIRSDQQRLAAAQEAEAVEAKATSVDFTT